jgi:hypothetical protein
MLNEAAHIMSILVSCYNRLTLDCGQHPATYEYIIEPNDVCGIKHLSCGLRRIFESEVLQLFIELIALPPNAICFKCYDFEWPTNSSSHFLSLSSTFVMTSILSFCGTTSVSAVLTVLTCHC